MACQSSSISQAKQNIFLILWLTPILKITFFLIFHLSNPQQHYFTVYDHLYEQKIRPHSQYGRNQNYPPEISGGPAFPDGQIFLMFEN